MSDYASVPLPTVIYDWDCHWPAAGSALGVTSAFPVNGELVGGAVVQNLWDILNGGGSSTIDKMGTLNAICGTWTSTAIASAQRGMIGWSCYVPLTVGNLPAGFQYPSPFRLWRWQFLVQTKTAFTPRTNCNLMLMCGAGTQPGVFSQNNPGFGIAGSVVTPGRWRWVSRATSGPGIDQSIELNISQAVPTLFDFVVQAASPGGPASHQLYVNGNYAAPVVNVTFGTNGLPANYGDPINSLRYCPIIENSDQVNFGTLQVGAMRMMMGHFTPQGAAV